VCCFLDTELPHYPSEWPAIVAVADLAVHVARVHAEHYGVYGPRKVWLQLNRQGVPVARCAVERLMRALGVCGVRRGRAGGRRGTSAGQCGERDRVVADPGHAGGPEWGVLERLPMFTRLTPDGVAWSDGRPAPAGVILWCPASVP
jgi:transposase InsO family protein